MGRTTVIHPRFLPAHFQTTDNFHYVFNFYMGGTIKDS